MHRIAILYATREGHTGRIAEHISATLRARGFDPEILNLRENDNQIVLYGYTGVILAAAVHFGKHESEMIQFVKSHRSELEAVPSAFLSVNLAEAAAERPGAAARQHAQFVATAEKNIDGFFAETGWHAQRVKPVAGALLYTQYNILMRFVMRRIAQRTGGDPDVSRNYEYTNWAALDQFVEEFASHIAIPAAHGSTVG